MARFSVLITGLGVPFAAQMPNHPKRTKGTPFSRRVGVSGITASLSGLLTAKSLSFPFFTMGMMDILYDTYLPIFLGHLFEKIFEGKQNLQNLINTITGFIMTFDNILAVFLIPIVSIWSAV